MDNSWNEVEKWNVGKVVVSMHTEIECEHCGNPPVVEFQPSNTPEPEIYCYKCALLGDYGHTFAISCSVCEKVVAYNILSYTNPDEPLAIICDPCFAEINAKSVEILKEDAKRKLEQNLKSAEDNAATFQKRFKGEK